MTTSTSFLVLAGTASFALVVVLAVSIVIGMMRRQAGYQLSAEIEQAAGMENRWRPTARTALVGVALDPRDRQPHAGHGADHAAA